MQDLPAATTVSFPTMRSRDLLRMQCPDPDFTIDGVRFCEDPGEEESDWLVCYGDFNGRFETRVPRKRRILVITEPKEIRQPSRAFLDQFGVLLGPGSFPSFRGTHIASHGALTWFYPLRDITTTGFTLSHDFAALEAMQRPPKQAAISVVISRKTITPMHRQRLAFVERLRAAIGERLKIYGSGFTPISAKAEVIDPYAFHLALENNAVDGFWTEKIADAYLGHAFPVYAGCRDLGDYFPAGSFLPIDYDHTDEAIAAIKMLLDAPEDPQRIAAVAEARRRLLHEHTLLALLARTIRALTPDAQGPRLAAPEQLTFDKGLRTKGERFQKWLRRLTS